MRKKILIGGTIILVAGIWLLWFLGGEALKKQANPTLAEINAQRDSDQDGLADWEEALWQTNKNNPDTDGDGTPDGEEVTLGRDPKKAGPDDAIANPTDQVNALTRKALFEKNDILQESVSTQDLYRLDNIKLADSDIGPAVIQYRDQIREALKTYTAKMSLHPTDEVDLLIGFVENKNLKALTELNASKDNHQELLNTLLETEVPPGAATIHLAILNSLKKTVITLTQMAQVTTEPLLAMKSSLLLHQQRGEWYTEMIPLANYFSSQGINMDL